MLQAERLSRLTVMGPKTVMKKTIEKLHELEVCHIENHTKKNDSDLDISPPLDNSENLSSLIVNVRAVKSSFTGNDSDNEKKGKKDNVAINQAKNNQSLFLSTAKKNTEKVQSQVAAQNENIHVIDEQLRAIADEIKQISAFAPLRMDISTFTEFESVDYFVGTIEQPEKFKHKLNSITTKCKINLAKDENSNDVMALFIIKNKSGSIQDILSEHKFTAFDMSQISAKKGKPSEILVDLRKQERQLIKQKNEILHAFCDLAKQWSAYFNAVESVLAIELEKAEAPLRFASTASSFVLKGWVPTKKEQEVKKSLNDATSNKVYIVLDAVKEQRKDETIPIKFNNPKSIRPFEFFMNLYTLPQYKEIDPTFLMFLTFPIFYGFMLGDIGYGIVTLALFLWLRTKVKGEFGKLVNAMLYASFATIIFGILFGEVFGLEEIGHFALPHILSRAHDINQLMLLALALGVVHVNIGLVIGFYNVWRAHGFMHAVNEKLSWMVLQGAVVCIALAYTEYIPVTVEPKVGYIGILLVVLALVMIYKGEGVKGLIELPAIFTNVLSYARLMAVGLASVILASVVNEFAGQMFHSGIIGILGGTILLVVGHGINIMLGLISPFLHSTRLHYVEFFTKFYEGGGLKFIPFGAKEED